MLKSKKLTAKKTKSCLFLKIAKKALLFKQSKPGDLDYFTASVPIKKYAMKYSEEELRDQIREANEVLKNES